MKILLLNPNTTVEVTELMAQVGRAVASPGTEIVSCTAERGVPYIAVRAEAQVAGAIALEMLAERHKDFDAAVIAAFGDPGLMGARELFDIPIIGLAEATMLTACMLGKRFAIVTFSSVLVPWYEECVDINGLSRRCAGICTLEGSFSSISGVAEEKEAALVSLANKVVADTLADVLIFAGAPLSGLARKVADRVMVPVIDQVEAAICQAETLVRLSPKKARTGTFRRPDPKKTYGLHEALSQRIEHRDRAGQT